MAQEIWFRLVGFLFSWKHVQGCCTAKLHHLLYISTLLAKSVNHFRENWALSRGSVERMLYAFIEQMIKAMQWWKDRLSIHFLQKISSKNLNMHGKYIPVECILWYHLIKSNFFTLQDQEISKSEMPLLV